MLPPEDNEVAEIVVYQPVEASVLVMREGRGENTPPLVVMRLEKHLAHQAQMILGYVSQPADDGPYAQHPVMHDLPLAVREDIAEAIDSGHVIVALAILRNNRPELSLIDAHVIVTALRHVG